jgi:ATP-dependent DNA ligase
MNTEPTQPLKLSMIPSYPLRPTNGGPLHRARPKRGQWAYEPKVNGWRALVHAPTGKMWNRQGKRLSIEREFAFVLKALQDAELPPEFEWLDCEAFERRHALGRGSLVLLDYIPKDNTPYQTRRENIQSLQIISTLDPLTSPQNDMLWCLPDYREDDILPPAEIWEILQDYNKKHNAEVFEGLVAKKLDSTYPRQLRSPNLETPHWIKHRWEF